MEKIESRNPRRTKIVCTIGPSTESEPMIEKLVRAGMDCARLNFSHGILERHARVISTIRKVSRSLGKQIAIMQDLPGPKIRVGKLPSEFIDIKRGDTVFLEGAEEVKNDQRYIPISYANLGKYVEKGSDIYLSDGAIKLRVLEAEENRIKCICSTGGRLLSGKGVNIPKLKHGFKAFTEKDEEFLRFGLEKGVDLVAVSFVRTADDIRQVRRFTKKAGEEPAIIAKIEKREAVENLKSIIDASDSVMVARGDLGVENPIERVPVIQKMIISDCKAAGKPVITATQILESMVNNPTPTRAEVSDIANAILDGTDALMLSEETAVGKYPVECVQVLHKVSTIIEEKIIAREDVRDYHEDLKDSLSEAAYVLSRRISAKFILSLTNSLAMATKISRFRPKAPIVAFTNDERQSRKLNIVWGVYPSVITKKRNLTDLMSDSIKGLKEYWPVRPSDRIVIVCDDVSLSGQTGELIFAMELADRVLLT
ncbi:MAG: pyruvate kinase [Nitrososphaerota archaeon]